MTEQGPLGTQCAAHPEESAELCSLEAESAKVLGPYGLDLKTYIDQYILPQYTNTAKSMPLPHGFMDASEYVTELSRLESEVAKAKQEQQQLEQTVEGIQQQFKAVPPFYEQAFKQQFQGGYDHQMTQLQLQLGTKQAITNCAFKSLAAFVERTQSVDGKAFEAKMRPLLEKRMALLAHVQKAKAEAILEKRLLAFGPKCE